MNISHISLRRPVFAIVMNLVIVLFGIIGFKFLGVRDYPAIDPPNISVRTSYAGANSDIIESQITEPLEKAINGIAGVKNITSSSNQGSSNINVEFELGVDLEAAANDVRDKVSQASRSLATGCRCATCCFQSRCKCPANFGDDRTKSIHVIF